MSAAPSTQERRPYREAHSERESGRLLALAETLLEKREQTMELFRVRNRENITYVAFTLFVSTGSGLYYGAHLGANSGFGVGTGVFLWFIVAYLAVVSRAHSLEDLQSRLRRDERALAQLVAILRESQQAFAEEEQWSVLEQAEFRIRLARFDIGPTDASVPQMVSQTRIRTLKG